MSLQYETEENPHTDRAEREVMAPARVFPWYSLVLILCYSAVFAAQMAAGLETSILLAGEDKQAILHHSEWWRLLTGAALHAGVLHFAMNSYAFYSFGKDLELLSNKAHVAIVFLLSAIGGAVLTLVLNPVGISVGASGGIVGLVGYLAVYSFKRRAFINPEFRRALIFNIAFILFYGFVLMSTVDNWAHIGGLIVGAAYAFIQVPVDEYVDPRLASRPAELLGIVSIGVYAATCAFAIAVILRFI